MKGMIIIIVRNIGVGERYSTRSCDAFRKSYFFETRVWGYSFEGDMLEQLTEKQDPFREGKIPGAALKFSDMSRAGTTSEDPAAHLPFYCEVVVHT
jgi:hypothetical protein